ncbi:MAG: biotin/lipoyl-binding protein [Steroidobacteraceae bacterium]
MNDPRRDDLAGVDAAQEPASPRGRLFAIFGLVVLVAGLGGGWWWHESARAVSTDNAYVAADVANVMSQTEGTVIVVHAAETGAVRRGDVLVELDPSDARIALAQAEAEYARVRRRVQQYYEEDKAAAAQVR